MESTKGIKSKGLYELLHKTETDDSESSSSTDSDSESSIRNSSSSTPLTPVGVAEVRAYEEHIELLTGSSGRYDPEDVSTAPIFVMPVLEHVKANMNKYSEAPFAQYGLLGGDVHRLNGLTKADLIESRADHDPRVFVNIASPSSTFICGSQGSGKSHTLSCLLENALVQSPVNRLPHPLTALVFHYDTFISDDGGSPCEAAFLCSNPEIKVRVLCAPTNLSTIQKSYQRFQNITVEPLQINESNLNTKRMLDLMAVSHNEGPQPLYMHTVQRILRDMRLQQQKTHGCFVYSRFKQNLEAADLIPTQLGPLQQRLDMLESYMPKGQTVQTTVQGKKKAKGSVVGETLNRDKNSEAGRLTIVDLSCPCVTPESACGLFNIYLSIFLEGSTTIGRVIALDEAHKYMNSSAEASTFTESLLATMRLQRHLGVQIIISTQEPTVSPVLLDLSSVTIVHRFTSPEWLRTLERHLAGAASELLKETAEREKRGDSSDSTSTARRIFGDIVSLRVGEALLFSPSAVIGVLDATQKDGDQFKRLGAGYMKIRVRSRITTDGGKSVMAI